MATPLITQIFETLGTDFGNSIEEKKEIIAKILEGDQKAKDKWYVIERNLQELMDNGNVEAERELAKWDDLLYEAGL